MKIIECLQKSPEWYAARCGVPTASSFDCIVTSKGEPSKQRQKYLYKTAGEALTGVSEDTYQSASMLRGVEMEAEARAYYELVNDVEIKQVGFCMMDELNAGASPDGLVGEDGLVEIKCPIISTHVGYLLDNKLPTDYIQQVQGELFVTGRKWCDFISYYPGLKPLVIRVYPDVDFVRKLETELKSFCAELEEIKRKLR